MYYSITCANIIFVVFEYTHFPHFLFVPIVFVKELILKNWKELWKSLDCQVYELWLVFGLTFVTTAFNLEFLSGNLTYFYINIWCLCQLSEYFKSIKWMCWTFRTFASGEDAACQRPDGIAGCLRDCPRGRGQRGGRVCSADSNVSPRYQNFFINEGTQTSEGRGWGWSGPDEEAVCKHPSPALCWLAVPDLTTCFWFFRGGTHPLARKLRACLWHFP